MSEKRLLLISVSEWYGGQKPSFFAHARKSDSPRGTLFQIKKTSPSRREVNSVKTAAWIIVGVMSLVIGATVAQAIFQINYVMWYGPERVPTQSYSGHLFTRILSEHPPEPPKPRIIKQDYPDFVSAREMAMTQLEICLIVIAGSLSVGLPMLWLLRQKPQRCEQLDCSVRRSK